MFVFFYCISLWKRQSIKYRKNAAKLVCGRADTNQHKYFDPQTANIEILLHTLSVK